MATEKVTLTIQLNPEQAALLEKIARLRTRQVNPQAPVDLSSYIFNVLNKDIAACLQEIKQRRRP